jgi:hypothetical protein
MPTGSTRPRSTLLLRDDAVGGGPSTQNFDEKGWSAARFVPSDERGRPGRRAQRNASLCVDSDSPRHRGARRYGVVRRTRPALAPLGIRASLRKPHQAFEHVRRRVAGRRCRSLDPKFSTSKLEARISRSCLDTAPSVAKDRPAPIDPNQRDPPSISIPLGPFGTSELTNRSSGRSASPSSSMKNSRPSDARDIRDWIER